jgi:ribosome maturation factor RimP
MIKEEYIKSLAEEHLKDTDKFPVLVKVKPGNKIMVFIDADGSVTISDCIQLSRFIESHLDREKEDFELEVSSAGLDFPLSMERQYKKNIGREVKVTLIDGTVKKGLLSSLSDQGIEIIETVVEKKNKKKEITKVPVSLKFEQIKETKLEIKI